MVGSLISIISQSKGLDALCFLNDGYGDQLTEMQMSQCAEHYRNSFHDDDQYMFEASCRKEMTEMIITKSILRKRPKGMEDGIDWLDGGYYFEFIYTRTYDLSGKLIKSRELFLEGHYNTIDQVEQYYD